MDISIEDLKKKIIYRSTYRGTKEMDFLLSSFVKEIIDDLKKEELYKLLNFLEIDDENLYKLNQGLKLNIIIQEDKIFNLFKTYKLNRK